MGPNAGMFDRAERHVWEHLSRSGVSEETSDTGTVENMLDAGYSLAEIAEASARVMDDYICWLD